MNIMRRFLRLGTGDIQTLGAGGGGGGGTVSPLTTKGDVWGFSTVNARIPVGANGTVLTADSTQTLGVKYAAAGSSLLAVTSYQGSGGDATYTTTSATFADVDAANLAVTFTAPASGNVLVRVTVPGIASTAGVAIFFDLREATTNIGFRLISSSTQIVSLAGVFYVTGISAGSHTYKLGWSTASSTATLYYGSTTRGPVVMEVWTAP